MKSKSSGPITVHCTWSAEGVNSLDYENIFLHF